MIPAEQALACILGLVQPLAAERCAPAGALGRVLAEDVTSPLALPPFDNSAMDGFALRVGAEGAAAGSEFSVEGSHAAGEGAVRARADAWEIMTGASLPEGLDAVVPVEQVEVLATDAAGHPRRIRLTAPVACGQHLRRRGSDIAAGSRVLAAGTLLEPAQWMLLAALGVAEVAVAPRPAVALITTGRELVDDPAASLAPGQIRNSNRPFLAARLAAAGARVVWQETVADDVAGFDAALERALAAGARLVVTTGAVSMGRHDFIPEALAARGASVHFHKLALRPGKPLLCASLAGGEPFFGLPGNPVSAAVGLRFFVEPALRRMLGMVPERALQVPLAAPFAKRHRLRMYLKGRVTADACGRLAAHILQGQESFRIAPLLAANAWLEIPAEADEMEAGTPVAAWGLGHLDGLRPVEAAA